MGRSSGSGGSGVSIGGKRVGARSVNRVVSALSSGQEVTYRGNNGKTYRARVEERTGVRWLIVRGTNSNRALTSRQFSQNLAREYALNILAG